MFPADFGSPHLLLFHLRLQPEATLSSQDNVPCQDSTADSRVL